MAFRRVCGVWKLLFCVVGLSGVLLLHSVPAYASPRESASTAQSHKKVSARKLTSRTSSRAERNRRQASTSISADRGTFEWQQRDGKIFYRASGDSDGGSRATKKFTGWCQLSGTVLDRSSSGKHWFYFADDGSVLTGLHQLTDRNNGRLAWFYFQEDTGAAICNTWNVIKKGDGEKWYYHGSDGAAYTGQHKLVGGFANDRGHQGLHWFYFDEKTAEQIRGWKEITYQNKWCYYGNDGAMLKGQHRLIGGYNQDWNWFYFDEETGGTVRGVCFFTDGDKHVYYQDDGTMAKGPILVEGFWCHADQETGALSTDNPVMQLRFMYLREAMAIANDDAHGYDQGKRWGPDYDCSSLVISSVNRAFDKVRKAPVSANYTGDMRKGFTAAGFIWIPIEEIKSQRDLRMGDIMLNEALHTALYAGHKTQVVAHKNEKGEIRDGEPGDQNGREICIDFYRYRRERPFWNGILRYVG